MCGVYLIYSVVWNPFDISDCVEPIWYLLLREVLLIYTFVRSPLDIYFSVLFVRYLCLQLFWWKKKLPVIYDCLQTFHYFCLQLTQIEYLHASMKFCVPCLQFDICFYMMSTCYTLCTHSNWIVENVILTFCAIFWIFWMPLNELTWAVDVQFVRLPWSWFHFKTYEES